MCQLLGMNCAAPTDFNFSFRGFARRGGDTDKHEHGWGVAIYEGRGLRTFHDPLPAAKSQVAEFVAQYPMKTLNMMAHIRYATQGTVSLENVHPFQREMWGIQWCFAHNGDVPMFDCRNNIKTEYPMLGCCTTRFYHPVGDTDSEAVFCAILNALRAEFTQLPTLPLLYETIQRLCCEIVSYDKQGTILNFLLGCGQYTLFAYSWPGARPGSKVWNGLHYTIRRPPFSKARLADVDYAVDFSEVTTPSDRVAVIATGPLTVDEEWKEFKRGQLHMFDNGWGYSELYDCHEVEQQGRGLSSRAMSKCCEKSYDTPALLRTLVDDVVGRSSGEQSLGVWAKRGADLGCGSGGSGAAFRSCVEHLSGVDICLEMIDKARIRGCYDELVLGDVECILAKDAGSDDESQRFDLIFACNVFSYIRELRPLFQSVRNSLVKQQQQQEDNNNASSSRGIFAFSAEIIEGSDRNTKDMVVLQSCARYAHDREYILEELVTIFGFEIKAYKESDCLRMHEGRVVKGVLVVLSLV